MSKQIVRSKPRATVVPRTQDAFTAERYIVTLEYTDELVSKTNAGNQFIYYRNRMNDVFDPNPLVLTGQVVGFPELAAIYGRYMVIHFSAELEFINNEAFPVSILVAPSLVDLATVVTGPIPAINISELPHAKEVLLSATGGMNRGILRFNLDLPVFTGQPAIYHDSIHYTALTNASPGTQLFFNIAALSAINFTAAGLTQLCTYKYRVVFTERKIPSIALYKPLSYAEKIERAVKELAAIKLIGPHIHNRMANNVERAIAQFYANPS